MGWTNGIILGILGVLIGVTIFGGMGTATGYLLGFIAYKRCKCLAIQQEIKASYQEL